jgi:ribonuclease HI
MEELRFWYSNLDGLNGYSIRPKFSTEPVHVYTDASGVGFGGHLAAARDIKTQGHWSPAAQNKSSTYRELLAISLVLGAFSKQLQHKKAKIFSDSQGACHIVTVGSRIPELQSIALHIFQLCLVNDIEIETQWIPRTDNKIADTLSKTVDLDDWKLHPDVFSMLHKLWGPYDIDRFASSYNAQLPRFNSRFWCPNAEAVDAFTQNWASACNWLCPPVALIIPTIRHMSMCAAEGTLIVPKWPSAIFWPIIMPSPGRYAYFIKAVLVLPKRPALCIPGEGQLIAYRSKPSLFMGTPSFDLLALRIEFGAK